MGNDTVVTCIARNMCTCRTCADPYGCAGRFVLCTPVVCTAATHKKEKGLVSSRRNLVTQ